MWRLLAHKSALGFWAIIRAVALPVAHGFLTNGFALGWRVCALGMAFRVLADSLTLWATALLAVFHRTAHFALGFAALNLAFGAAQLLAACRALGGFTDRLADLVANRTVTFPLALRVTVIALAALRTTGCRSGGENNERRHQHHLHCFPSL